MWKHLLLCALLPLTIFGGVLAQHASEKRAFEKVVYAGARAYVAGDFARAIRYKKQVVALKPAEPIHQLDLAMTLKKAGRYPEARKAFLTLRKSNDATYVRVANVQLREIPAEQ